MAQFPNCFAQGVLAQALEQGGRPAGTDKSGMEKGLNAVVSAAFENGFGRDATWSRRPTGLLATENFADQAFDSLRVQWVTSSRP